MENKPKDLSDVVITSNGIVNNANNGVEIPCPTCKAKGSIPDPKYFGKMMMYCGPDGERVPHISCRTCSGSGWIFTKI